MKFLKGMIGRKRADETEEVEPEMSIATLQADLDHSGLDRSLRDPALAWSEKAAQRPLASMATEAGPDDDATASPVGDFEGDGASAPAREVSRDLDWDEEVGDAEDTSLREAFDAPRARRQTRPVAVDDFASSDDGFDEIEEDEFDDEFDELDPEEEAAIRDNALLVDEIRDAIAAVRHIETNPTAPRPETEAEAKARKQWEHDEVFGRKAIARDRLARLAENGDDDRILEETNHKMYDDDAANRRRQAMAHLKAAAAATKADRVLKRVVGRDPAMDPDQQVQYREDLANVVRQRGPRSEPISRPLSRPRTRPLSMAIPAAQTAQSAPQPSAPSDEATAEPTHHDQLRHAVSRPAEPEPTATPQETPAHPEPSEAKMDVEKIDLKTALERQKAILKAEREALEAEIAGESAQDTTPDVDADESLQTEPMAGVDPEAEPVSEPEKWSDPAPEQVRAFDAAFDAESDGGFEDDLEDDADITADAPTFETATDEEPGFDAPSPEIEEQTIREDDEAAFEDWDDGLGDDDKVVAEAAEVVPTLEQIVDDAEAEAPAEDEVILNLESDEPLAAALQPQAEAPAPEAAPDAAMPEAAPAAAPARKAGRVKTRLLGFQAKSESRDVFAGQASTGAGPVRFPVGWLVITEGEGFGHSFSLLSGVSKIGRGDDQAVQLDFGDTAISRDNHAAVAFDEELNQFFLGHGGKSNVVRLNGKPVLSTEELFDGDEIRIGETTLKFIALCSEEFTWAENSGDDTDHARSA